MPAVVLKPFACRMKSKLKEINLPLKKSTKMVFSGTILVCTYGVSPQFGVFFVCNKPTIHHQIAAP
jgi:hypothetical protein